MVTGKFDQMWENERRLSLLTKEMHNDKETAILFFFTSEIMRRKDPDGNILRNQMETKCIHLFQSSALIVF